jgi:DNA-binding transcriptional LysR family regulator
VADGHIDAAIVPSQLKLPRGVSAQPIGSLAWRCYGRQGHPAFVRWRRETWAQWPHLAVRVGDNLTSPVNVAASAASLQRTIAGWVPHFSAIAPVLAHSDLLTTLPAIAMAETLRVYKLESRKVPFPIAPLPHALIWSAGRAAHPEMIWLRARLRSVVKSTFTDIAGARH